MATKREQNKQKKKKVRQEKNRQAKHTARSQPRNKKEQNAPSAGGEQSAVDQWGGIENLS